jgi:hypothetical protein
MSEPKHTPGPWWADIRKAPSASYVVSKADESRIIIEMTPECQPSQADLALILAGPDLLAALKALYKAAVFNCRETPDLQAAVDQAVRAIRLAQWPSDKWNGDSND